MIKDNKQKSYSNLIQHIFFKVLKQIIFMLYKNLVPRFLKAFYEPEKSKLVNTNNNPSINFF